MYLSKAIGLLTYSLLFLAGTLASPISSGPLLEEREVDHNVTSIERRGALQNACCYQVEMPWIGMPWLVWYKYSIQIADDKSMDAECGRGILDNVRGRGCAVTSWGCRYVNGNSAQVGFNVPGTCSVDDIQNAVHAASQSLDIWLHCSKNGALGSCDTYKEDGTIE